MGYILQKSVWRRLPVLQKVQYYCRIPGIKALIQLYYTSFFASEWGLLLQQGLETQTNHLMYATVGTALLYA